ncbi:MAG: FHA domain-containing protein [Planctomycetaceae bacterium]|nr:FHA domain-containing protein [Planctomycetaceae bacterium]MCA9064969.1 FHA domain-containing protein [Planctomycetaceae bacterium]
MALLRSTELGDGQQWITLPPSECTIGRDESCDLKISSPAVSRLHARILFIDERFWIEDLQSRNHTHLNGRRIDKREPLRDGDALDFAGIQFVFYLRPSLEDETGSVPPWDDVVSEITPDASEDGSISRVLVQANDVVLPDNPHWNESFQQKGIRCIVPPEMDPASSATASNAAGRLQAALAVLADLQDAANGTELLTSAATAVLYQVAPAERAAIVLLQDQQLVVASCATRIAGKATELCLPLVLHVMRTGETVLYEDHWTAGWNPGDGKAVGRRQILVAPLADGPDSICGVIQLDAGEKSGDLNEGHAGLLAMLARIVSSAMRMIRNAGMPSSDSTAITPNNTTA